MKAPPPTFSSPLALALLALLLAGCHKSLLNFGDSGMDMFAPVSIRIHQLTRIVPATATRPQTAPATAPTPPATSPATAPAGPSVLEARVEMADQFADPTKSPGTITLQLFDQPPLTHQGDLIESWTFSLNSPKDNRDHWDRTLRMYLFKLPLVRPLPQREHLLLTATLTLPNGMELPDEMELPIK